MLGYQVSNHSPTQETAFYLTTVLDNVDVTILEPAVCGRKLQSNSLMIHHRCAVDKNKFLR